MCVLEVNNHISFEKNNQAEIIYSQNNGSCIDNKSCKYTFNCFLNTNIVPECYGTYLRC